MSDLSTERPGRGGAQAVGRGAGLYALSFLLTMLSSGCATPPLKVLSIAELGDTLEKRVELSGWFTGSREFQFYVEQSKIGELYNNNCISGVLSSEISPEEFAASRGKRVKITARVSDSESYMQETLGYFHNYCDQANFLIVSEFEVDE